MAGSEGLTFGKYFLLKKIASGGMGEIFLAKLTGPVGFEKLIVIKRMLAQLVENQEFVDMFFAEARVAAQLNHSNIVQIYEMGTIEGAHFIGMEYVFGRSFREVIDRWNDRGAPVPVGHVADIVSKLCSGLGYAHDAKDIVGVPLGIVHRDINPHNLLVSYSGEVKVIDFGIAKSEKSENKTEAGTIKGKFVYMSPEQSAAQPLDKRSDIFSIGICLYEALAGRNPFVRNSVMASLEAIQNDAVPPLADINPRFAALQPIIEKALAKKADDRYQTCAEMRDDLARLLASGTLDKPAESLSDYMHGLFGAEMDAEQQMLRDSDQANTSQLESMRDFQRLDHSGMHAPTTEDEAFDDVEGGLGGDATDVMELGAAPRSRLPFLLLIVAVLIATAVGAIGIVRYAQKRQNPGSTITEIPIGKPTAVTVAKPEVIPTPSPSPAPAPLTAAPLVPTTSLAPPSAAPAVKTTKLETRLPVDDRHGKHPERGDDKTAPSPAAPKPTPEPKPAVAAEPKGEGAGTLAVSTSPSCAVTVDGQSVGATIKLSSAFGKLVIGSGANATSDPFAVTVIYRIANGAIVYRIASEPWALVRGKGGIGLGKTPLMIEQHEGESSTFVELANQKEGRSLRITLRYTP
jgi:eukaryotic-like serine/threonine-protein kinase